MIPCLESKILSLLLYKYLTTFMVPYLVLVRKMWAYKHFLKRKKKIHTVHSSLSSPRLFATLTNLFSTLFSRILSLCYSTLALKYLYHSQCRIHFLLEGLDRKTFKTTLLFSTLDMIPIEQSPLDLSNRITSCLKSLCCTNLD